MTRLNGLLNDSTGQMSRSGQEERECVQSRRLQNRIGNLRSKLPRVDSNHDSAVQSRMSCHWTTGQTSGAMEINRWGDPGQIIPLQPSSESQRETGLIAANHQKIRRAGGRALRRDSASS